MNNINLCDGKTLFDLFNLIKPNLYQALAIECVINSDIKGAQDNIEHLKDAFQYYNWQFEDNHTDYTDSLICASNLERWQKMVLLFLSSNSLSEAESLLLTESVKQSTRCAKNTTDTKQSENTEQQNKVDDNVDSCNTTTDNEQTNSCNTTTENTTDSKLKDLTTHETNDHKSKYKYLLVSKLDDNIIENNINSFYDLIKYFNKQFEGIKFNVC